MLRTESDRERIYERLPIPLQTAALNFEAWRKKRLRYDEKTLSSRAEVFERLERAPREEIRAWQADKLRETLQHAWDQSPQHRRRFEAAGVHPRDLQTVDDLRAFPILDRQELVDHNREFLAESERENHVRTACTSGTTGSPLEIHWDRQSEWWNTAAYSHHRKWFGFEIGTPYASLTGRKIVPLQQKGAPYWRRNHSANQLLLSSYHLSSETLPAYVEALDVFQPRMLEAYPSTAWLLARHLNELGRTLPLDAVHLSSEPLLDFQREAIEKAFECRAFDYYGCSERSLAAGECEAHDGLHVFEPFGYTEILDDNDEPAPPGQYGRLVLTGFHNRLMPFIRYEIRDASAFIAGDCPCGRTWRRISSVTTKAEDIIVTPDGRMLSPSTLHYPFMAVNTVEASQIEQNSADRLLIRLVARDGHRAEHTETIRKALSDRMGPGCTIDFDFVQEIPRGRTGKFRWVVSKVELPFSQGAAANLYEGRS